MRLWALARRDLVKSRGRFGIVGALVAMGVAVVVIFGSLGVGLWKGVVEPLLPKLPLGLIKVEPRVLSLGLFAFDGLGGGLDAKALETLAGLPGVQRVFPMRGAAFPLSATGGEGFLGHSVRTDLFATGLSPELVAADVSPGKSFEDPGPGSTKVPVLVARRLLDLYNTTVAPSIQKPRLSAEALIGFRFELVVGASYVRGTPDPSHVERLTAEIVGVSDQATLVGITVPAAVLERWSKERSVEPPIVAAFVRTKHAEDAGPVMAAIDRLGFSVDETAKIVAAVTALASIVLSVFALVLLVLSAFAIAQTFFLLVTERRIEIAVLRAMGARQRDVRRLLMLEASMIGGLGGGLGVILGVGASALLNVVLLGVLPEVPFKPASFVSFPPALLAAAGGLGLVAALVGAAFPAARAAAIDPARALRD
ncbi:MAG: FtsX-like permease family protein [Deltaproteobacteria bacterium]|nr:FtsX-like permease family protein [Deltaproteobacteria bacterium]